MNTDKLYVGIDLHSNNSYVAVINEIDQVIHQRRVGNDLEGISSELEPYREQIDSVVIESTYNWYWLADGLQEKGHRVRLAHVGGNQQYSGLKHSNDKTDAIWLAKMARLNVLEEGSIYPKERRGLRELLRRRLWMVQDQTRSVLSLHSLGVRYENLDWTGKDIKKEGKAEDLIRKLNDPYVREVAKSQLSILRKIMKEIKRLEELILKEIKQDAGFKRLTDMPGIGPILAMTILLETGDIARFKGAGNYSSYCRCVESKRISNEKKKGHGNRKNGSPYLGWAFIEAANVAVRAYEPIKKFYQRKMQKTMRVIALKAVANKLSKACYFILRDGVPFDMKKCF